MKTNCHTSDGVLLSRYDSNIQYSAHRFLKKYWETDRIGLLTIENPLHLLYHNVNKTELEVLYNHITEFLDGGVPKQLALAGGQLPSTLTDGEINFKLEIAVNHLRARFPKTQIEGLFVNQKTGVVEVVSSKK